MKGIWLYGLEKKSLSQKGNESHFLKLQKEPFVAKQSKKIPT